MGVYNTLYTGCKFGNGYVHHIYCKSKYVCSMYMEDCTVYRLRIGFAHFILYKRLCCMYNVYYTGCSTRLIWTHVKCCGTDSFCFSKLSAGHLFCCCEALIGKTFGKLTQSTYSCKISQYFTTNSQLARN